MFSEARSSPELFDTRPSASDDWEVSFYRSLLNVDGVILIGVGGQP